MFATTKLAATLVVPKTKAAVAVVDASRKAFASSLAAATGTSISNTTAPSTTFSHTLSFASPESDFCDGSHGRNFSTMATLDTTNSPAAWSNTMSFASPESDFCDGSQGRSFSTIAAASIASSSHNGSAWSNTMSFASPESDFCDSSHGQSFSTLAATTNRTAATLTNNAPAWSNTMTFASPESDFCDSSSILSATSTSSSEVLPKSWFVAHANQHVSTQWSHTLSFASPESDFCDGSRSLYSLLKTSSPFSMQPRTMAQAMASPLACVVTTKSHPHKIVCVNAAWEDLCGFKQAEVINQTLSIIQGPQTNTELADKTVEAALQNSNNDSDRINDMYVVNYKKNGESFTNHVTISTMMLSPDQSDVEFLVGVLEPVEQSPLRCIA